MSALGLKLKLCLNSGIVFKHDFNHFSIGSKKLLHSIALIVFALWAVQVSSGLILLGLLSYSLETQFADLVDISLHGNYV